MDINTRITKTGGKIVSLVIEKTSMKKRIEHKPMKRGGNVRSGNYIIYLVNLRKYNKYN